VVSELFADAVQHGPADGPVLVSYCLCGDGLRVVVCDPGGITIPTLRASHDLQEGGRGLHVVDMIAAAWGQFRVEHARVVYLRQHTFHRGAA
jgi:anti-sigma regulatory factor (Ser/Thr protein kinase)